MADPQVINNLAADPDFLKLSDSEQKAILGRVMGNSPVSQIGFEPKPVVPGGGSLKDYQVNTKAGPRSHLDDTIIDLLRPVLASAGAGAAGTLAAPSAPFTLGAGPVVAGAGAYTGIDALLQHLKSQPSTSLTSQALGLKPGSISSTLANTGEQYLGGKLLESGVGALARGGKALLSSDAPEIYKFLPTTSQAAENAGLNKTAAVAKTLEDFSISAKQKALDRSAGAGFTQALQTAKNLDFNFSRNPNTMLDLIRSDTPPGSIESFNVLDKAISDPNKLQEVLTTAQTNGVGSNLKKSLQGYQFMKMFDDATTRSLSEGNPYNSNVIKIDPSSFDKTWLDPKMQDSLKTLYNSSQRADIEQFFKNVAATQDKVSAMPIAKKIWLMRGGAAIGSGLLSGSLTGSAEIGGLTTVGTYIGAQQLGKLLTNPKTARLVVAMAGGEPLGVSEQYASRALSQALNGSVVALINDKGDKVPVRVQDGKYVPVKE